MLKRFDAGSRWTNNGGSRTVARWTLEVYRLLIETEIRRVGEGFGPERYIIESVVGRRSYQGSKYRVFHATADSSNQIRRCVGDGSNRRLRNETPVGMGRFGWIDGQSSVLGERPVQHFCRDENGIPHRAEWGRVCQVKLLQFLDSHVLIERRRDRVDADGRAVGADDGAP